jgi:hypothetical protein
MVRRASLVPDGPFLDPRILEWADNLESKSERIAGEVASLLSSMDERPCGLIGKTSSTRSRVPFAGLSHSPLNQTRVTGCHTDATQMSRVCVTLPAWADSVNTSLQGTSAEQKAEKNGWKSVSR